MFYRIGLQKKDIYNDYFFIESVAIWKIIPIRAILYESIWNAYIDAYNYLAFIVYDYLLTNHIYKLRYTKGGWF